MKQSTPSGKIDYEEQTGKVIGCAMRIHRVLGPGFNIAVYKHALAFEMNKMGLKFERDKELPVFYEGIKTGTVKVDFILKDLIIVETNNLPQIDQSKMLHESFLLAVNAGAGLLLNFGISKLEFATTYLSGK